MPSPKPTHAMLKGYATDLSKCLQMWGLDRLDAIIVARKLLENVKDHNIPYTASQNYAETRAMMDDILDKRD